MKFFLLAALLLAGCQIKFAIESPDTEAAQRATIKQLNAVIDSLRAEK